MSGSDHDDLRPGARWRTVVPEGDGQTGEGRAVIEFEGTEIDRVDAAAPDRTTGRFDRSGRIDNQLAGRLDTGQQIHAKDDLLERARGHRAHKQLVGRTLEAARL